MYELKIKFETLEALQEFVYKTDDAAPHTSLIGDTPPGITTTMTDDEPDKLIVAPTDSTTDADGTPPTDSTTDTDGTPWDERIHASTKTKSKNGVWKKKRGIDDELFKSIMAELSSGTINHSQLLAEIINGVAEGTLSIFTVQDVLAELGLGSLNDASGNIEIIETLATRLEFI